MSAAWAALIAAGPAVLVMGSLAFLGWRAGRRVEAARSREVRELAHHLAWINNHDERIDAIAAALNQRQR